MSGILQATTSWHAASGGGPVTIDAITSQSQNVSTGTVTVAHTCSGTNRVLLVAFSNRFGTIFDITGVTYNSVAMTQLGTINNSDSGANIEGWLFGLIAPATGANNVVVTIDAPPTDTSIGIISFNAANQTTAFGTCATATQNNSNSPSVTVVGATNDLIIDAVATYAAPSSATVGSGQTERAKLLASGGLLMSSEDGAASVVMDWSLGSNTWTSSLGVAVKAV